MSNKILKVILDGLYDEDCVLSKLRGCQHLLRVIWDDVNKYWTDAVILPDDPETVTERRGYRYRSPDASKTVKYFTPIRDFEEKYRFPPPSDININMMPFIVNEHFSQCR